MQLCRYNLQKLTSEIYVFTNLDKSLTFSLFIHRYPELNITVPIIYAKCDLRAELYFRESRGMLVFNSVCVCKSMYVHLEAA